MKHALQADSEARLLTIFQHLSAAIRPPTSKRFQPLMSGIRDIRFYAFHHILVMAALDTAPFALAKLLVKPKKSVVTGRVSQGGLRRQHVLARLQVRHMRCKMVHQICTLSTLNAAHSMMNSSKSQGSVVTGRGSHGSKQGQCVVARPRGGPGCGGYAGGAG